MRKRIITSVEKETAKSDSDWLDLEELAEVEITSEDPAHPIESALIPGRTSAWRAERSGEQTIRLLFPKLQAIRRILLEFEETQVARTQEFVLRWSSDGESYHEIVRQQWNFSPKGATSEKEDIQVELPAVSALELVIVPDTGGGFAVASLEHLRLC